ncbi:MAG: glutamate-1-semialdehyde-2,1-aminomutase [Sphaerobacteraceae bacterium]|nr:MAG: glutamate-1-semialdehyde-2,1-aminomutase [Sphaerobacteraceae bacterium]
MNHSRSEAAFAAAGEILSGGVNSPVRAFKAVGGSPVFMNEASGARIKDIDGNEYIDFVGSWGPMVVGHAHPEVVSMLHTLVARGTSFGTPTELETELGRRVVSMVPSIERVRFVNSGTEATMTAIRLARAVTERPKIIKFTGCYHGHSDSLLANAGSGVMTLGIPSSPGVTEGTVADTITLPYNSLPAVRDMFTQIGDQVAAVILEPIAGNMGVIPPAIGFLQGLRDMTREHGALLIFDEVISGFRVAPGGAQEFYGVTPDLTCLGKIVGGGLPVGAFGGRKDLMDHLAPNGPVYQAGTLSGNPLAMGAGIATLEVLANPDSYQKLDQLGSQLENGLRSAAESAGVPVHINRVGSMMTGFFQEGPVTNFETAATSNTDRYGAYHQKMLASGIYLAPSQFEATFVSLAHTEADIATAGDAAAAALKAIA